MPMADNPKLNLDSCVFELQKDTESTRNVSVSTEKSDPFVIDMDNFSQASVNKDSDNPTSRFSLQRSLPRKGSPRVAGGGRGRKIVCDSTSGDKNTVSADSSPAVRPNMPEILAPPPSGTSDPSSRSGSVHHQITITTTSNMDKEGRSAIKRSSFKRAHLSWTIDPKRVLFFFATLSSMGTMLLIYFTLSIGKLDTDDIGHN